MVVQPAFMLDVVGNPEDRFSHDAVIFISGLYHKNMSAKYSSNSSSLKIKEKTTFNYNHFLKHQADLPL